MVKGRRRPGGSSWITLEGLRSWYVLSDAGTVSVTLWEAQPFKDS